MGLILFTILACILLAGGLYVVFGRNAISALDTPLTFPIERKPYVSRVIDQGEIESATNVEIRSEVKKISGYQEVIWAIPEGARVKEGDVLVELDSALIELRRDQQKIRRNTAEARVIQSEANLAAAREAKNEYFQGKYLEALKRVENQIALAQEDLRKAEQAVAHSRKLESKGYLAKMDLENSEFAVVSYQNDLDLALQRKEVILGPTKRRMDIQYDADIRALEVKLENDKKSLLIEQQELEGYEEQVALCTIRCPEGVSGQVVHANVLTGSRTWVLEEGATVYERQVLIRIPDLTDLEIKASINESQITAVEVGMPVLLTIDALDANTEFRGEVNRVNSYPEPESWGTGGVKKYGVGVKIFDPPENVRPGMNAFIDIQTEYEDNALQVANQCLLDHKGHIFGLVWNDGECETVELTVNSTNEKRAWLKEDPENGIVEGTQLVMNPRAFEDLLNLPEIKEPAYKNHSMPERSGSDESADLAPPRGARQRGDVEKNPRSLDSDGPSGGKKSGKQSPSQRPINGEKFGSTNGFRAPGKGGVATDAAQSRQK